MTEVAKKKSKIVPIIIALVAVLAILAVVLLTVTGSESSKISRKMAKAEKYVLALEYEKAIDLYEQVLEINPKYLDAYLGLADVYMEMDKPEKAVKILEKALKKIKDSDDIEVINDKMREISGSVSEDITNAPGVTEESEAIVKEEEDLVEERAVENYSEKSEAVVKEEEEIVEEEVVENYPEGWKVIKEGNHTYEYDSLGRLIKKEFHTPEDWGLGSRGDYTEYTYYDNGQLKEETYYKHDGAAIGYRPYKSTYYNENGLETRYEDYYFVYYTKKGRAEKKNYGYEYDDRGFPVRKLVFDDKNKVVEIFNSEYDDFGNETAYYSTKPDGVTLNQSAESIYREYVKIGDKYYVSVERIEGGNYPCTTYYTYDDYGNCIKNLCVGQSSDYANVEVYEYDYPAFPKGEVGDTFTRTKKSYVCVGDSADVLETEIEDMVYEIVEMVYRKY